MLGGFMPGWHRISWQLTTSIHLEVNGRTAVGIRTPQIELRNLLLLLSCAK